MIIKRSAQLVFLLMVSAGLAKSAWASETEDSIELLMIDSDYCPYCRKFDREIASIYPKTDEGKRAPLKRHKLGDTLPKKYANLGITSGTLTPTFILLKNNKEVDRLLGYNGDEFFWYLLNDLLDSLEPHTK